MSVTDASGGRRPGQVWILIGRISLLLGVANGLFQILRNLAQTSANLHRLASDHVVTYSIGAAAALALFFGITTFAYGVAFRRSPFSDFAPDTQRIRGRLILSGLSMTAIGLVTALVLSLLLVAFDR
jgi:hypothetical protein